MDESDQQSRHNVVELIRDIKLYSVHQLGRQCIWQKPGIGSKHSHHGTYEFQGVFPTNVSQVDLSYESTDTIEEFTVELQVQYWTATGNGGCSLINRSKQYDLYIIQWAFLDFR